MTSFNLVNVYRPITGASCLRTEVTDSFEMSVHTFEATRRRETIIYLQPSEEAKVIFYSELPNFQNNIALSRFACFSLR
jgi:hypothetical protein